MNGARQHERCAPPGRARPAAVTRPSRPGIAPSTPASAMSHVAERLARRGLSPRKAPVTTRIDKRATILLASARTPPVAKISSRWLTNTGSTARPASARAGSSTRSMPGSAWMDLGWTRRSLKRLESAGHTLAANGRRPQRLRRPRAATSRTRGDLREPWEVADDLRVGAPHGRQDTRHARGIAIQERGRGPDSRDIAAAGTTDCSMPGTCSQLAMGLGSFAHLANRSSEPAAISRVVMLAPRRAATACASPGRDEATSGTLGVSRDPPRATASRRRWHQPRRARRSRQRRAGDERVELQWRFDGGRGDKGNNARTVERGTLAGRRRINAAVDPPYAKMAHEW